MKNLAAKKNVAGTNEEGGDFYHHLDKKKN